MWCSFYAYILILHSCLWKLPNQRLAFKVYSQYPDQILLIQIVIYLHIINLVSCYQCDLLRYRNKHRNTCIQVYMKRYIWPHWDHQHTFRFSVFCTSVCLKAYYGTGHKWSNHLCFSLLQFRQSQIKLEDFWTNQYCIGTKFMISHSCDLL